MLAQARSSATRLFTDKVASERSEEPCAPNNARTGIVGCRTASKVRERAQSVLNWFDASCTSRCI